MSTHVRSSISSFFPKHSEELTKIRAVAGQSSSSELHFANKAEMFSREKKYEKQKFTKIKQNMNPVMRKPA